ncbi:MAG: hypothetical protein PUP91_00245 [Rhizonema sp. PD37]|nr:hypothetical protein [Rhizonema sp. PD37]
MSRSVTQIAIAYRAISDIDMMNRTTVRLCSLTKLSDEKLDPRLVKEVGDLSLSHAKSDRLLSDYGQLHDDSHNCYTLQLNQAILRMIRFPTS